MIDELPKRKKRSWCYPIQASLAYRIHGQRMWRNGISRSISDAGILFQPDGELNEGVEFEAHLSLSAITDQPISISFQAMVLQSPQQGMCAARICAARLCRSHPGSHHPIPLSRSKSAEADSLGGIHFVASA